jgi:tRNA modification GTPase
VSDTIFALSSGLPPAGIAVVRVSGANAGASLKRLAGKLPPPRRASYVTFSGEKGRPLDDGLALWFPGPKTATGEDLAELHLHGGRAVVAAVLAELARHDGLREAKAGEFTRRAFENGRIDLTEAEGLADLLAAETESQRQAALALAEGGLARRVAEWQAAILGASALVEAELDLSDEGDVGEGLASDAKATIRATLAELEAMAKEPPAERLKDGIRIVLAGPPNSGKSSLFNSLVGRHAAIVTDIAGTTRDRIEAPVVLDGVPLLFIDTAGLREATTDKVEAIGIERSAEALAEADMILWLGDAAEMPKGAVLIAAKSDLGLAKPGMAVSTVSGAGLSELRQEIIARATALLPRPGSLMLNARHRHILTDLRVELAAASAQTDLLIMAEHLRAARSACDRLTGRAGVEDMLDALFGTFCVGK